MYLHTIFCRTVQAIWNSLKFTKRFKNFSAFYVLKIYNVKEDEYSDFSLLYQRRKKLDTNFVIVTQNQSFKLLENYNEVF